ncbi:uncharacterized protein LOC107261560 [Ricinus communis]|uniref:uncharacterized protein LOC107261560 n=1 Tax=Ricinus communis TaxID=3988 RepID=UPI0007728EFA|nr:uncharacterized protein LOC107261560 [Ricinus communis]|eukprot:XP_015577152.1 uncharacterized protein LOC107261560 [Ricinus communis]
MARIRIPTRKTGFLSIPNLLHFHYQSSKPTKTLTMAVSQSDSKRPTCPSCSKPSRLCLCTRIQNPGLENKVSITILQHSLEKKHPLNSARIAKLGLTNVDVVTVSDVNFSAQFFIRLLESGSGLNGLESLDFYSKESQKKKLDDMGSIKDSGNLLEDCDLVLGTQNESRINKCISVKNFGSICFTISKYGVISHVDTIWKYQIQPQERLNLGQILTCKVAVDAIAKGFLVKKLQRRQLSSSINLEEYEEFELMVPPGSALLFPSDTAVGVDELKEMNFGVKNLIVLDGTWAKAKRMYKENPWLRFLPHLKLDLDKLSLYNEVRHQPNAGCLSTIESIVYALKAVGDNSEGLDSLLDVFESMVGDQRRCKNERLSKVSPT